MGLGDSAARTNQFLRKVHDFLTVGAAAPLQQAGVTALELLMSISPNSPAPTKPSVMPPIAMLESAGMRTYVPRGAYYVMCDISNFGFPNDVESRDILLKRSVSRLFLGRGFFAIRRTALTGAVLLC